MPALETADLTDDAVYWPASPTLAENGRHVVTESGRRAVKCRWVEKRRQSTDANGDSIGYDATIALGFRPPDGSALWLGKVTDLPVDRRPTSNVFVVIFSNSASDVKGNAANTRYEAAAVRHGDSLPLPPE